MKKIFLHGLGQSSRSWDKTIKALNITDAICPNLSTLTQGQECTYANLYDAFSNSLNTDNELIDLCGLSLGAVLALDYTIKNPSRINSLILIAPQYKMPKALLKMQSMIFRVLPNSTFNNMGFTKGDFIKLTTSMAQLDFTNKLGEIICPTLILCGEKDNINSKASKQLTTHISGATFATISHAGHEVNIDAPSLLAKSINEFWR